MHHLNVYNRVTKDHNHVPFSYWRTAVKNLLYKALWLCIVAVVRQGLTNNCSLFQASSYPFHDVVHQYASLSSREQFLNFEESDRIHSFFFLRTTFFNRSPVFGSFSNLLVFVYFLFSQLICVSIISVFVC